MIDAATLTWTRQSACGGLAEALGTLMRRQAYIPLRTQLVLAATRKPVTHVSQAAEGTLAAATSQ